MNTNILNDLVKFEWAKQSSVSVSDTTYSSMKEHAK